MDPYFSVEDLKLLFCMVPLAALYLISLFAAYRHLRNRDLGGNLQRWEIVAIVVFMTPVDFINQYFRHRVVLE